MEATQASLPLRNEPIQVDITLIRRQPTFNRAIALCVEISGFEYDSQVYQELGIDAGHWTRIMNGSAHFPLDKLEPLMDLCENEVPLIWLADRRGYNLQRKLSLVEAELEDEKERRRYAEMKLEHFKEFNGAQN